MAGKKPEENDGSVEKKTKRQYGTHHSHRSFSCFTHWWRSCGVFNVKWWS